MCRVCVHGLVYVHVYTYIFFLGKLLLPQQLIELFPVGSGRNCAVITSVQRWHCAIADEYHEFRNTQCALAHTHTDIDDTNMATEIHTHLRKHHLLHSTRLLTHTHTDDKNMARKSQTHTYTHTLKHMHALV